jgi:hypothetical protein
MSILPHCLALSYKKLKKYIPPVEVLATSNKFLSCIKRRGNTVVQSLQAPPKPQGPSSGEQQGGWRKK